jgi:hypothetical protein
VKAREGYSPHQGSIPQRSGQRTPARGALISGSVLVIKSGWAVFAQDEVYENTNLLKDGQCPNFLIGSFLEFSNIA